MQPRGCVVQCAFEPVGWRRGALSRREVSGRRVGKELRSHRVLDAEAPGIDRSGDDRFGVRIVLLLPPAHQLWACGQHLGEPTVGAVQRAPKAPVDSSEFLRAVVFGVGERAGHIEVLGEVEQLAVSGARIIVSRLTRRDPDAVLVGPYRGCQHGTGPNQAPDGPCGQTGVGAKVALQLIKPDHGASGRRIGKTADRLSIFGVNQPPVRQGCQDSLVQGSRFPGRRSTDQQHETTPLGHRGKFGTQPVVDLAGNVDGQLTRYFFFDSDGVMDAQQARPGIPDPYRAGRPS